MPRLGVFALLCGFGVELLVNCVMHPEIIMAEVKRTRRNTLERRCLGKAFKRLFVRSPKGVFKMLEKVKRA